MTQRVEDLGSAPVPATPEEWRWELRLELLMCGYRAGRQSFRRCTRFDLAGLLRLKAWWSQEADRWQGRDGLSIPEACCQRFRVRVAAIATGRPESHDAANLYAAWWTHATRISPEVLVKVVADPDWVCGFLDGLLEEPIGPRSLSNPHEHRG